MKTKTNLTHITVIIGCILHISLASSQIGTRFPSEKKVVTDPVTGTQLTFLTSTPAGESKIYQTHPQWTADGEWVIFRSDRVRREAMADGTGLRPLYPESEYEWVTHEAVISKDEVAIAIMGHRKIGIPQLPVDPKNPGQETDWGPSGTREKPTGLGIVNLRTREMTIAGQTPHGSGLWHVNGSSDGRWAVGDDFTRGIYLIDRHTHEMILLTTGHKETAADHPHPTFNADGTKIEIQSAMLSEDNRSMDICLIPVPEAWLKRKYD